MGLGGLRLVEQCSRFPDSGCVERFWKLVDERGKRASVFGRCTVAVAQFNQRHQLQPRCLLRSGLRDRASDRGVGGGAVAAPTRDGYRRIREAYEDNTRLGMLAGGSEVLGYATEALVLAGDWDGAQHELEDALQVADTLGERVYLPQLLVMQAAIARARGDRAAADAAIRRAIAEARAQETPWLELMALIELCDRHSATAKDRRALAALVDQLPEALDTAAVARARALLDKTQSA